MKTIILILGALCSTPTSTSLTVTDTECLIALGAPSEWGAVIYSPAQLPPTPFGDGLLCLNPWAPGSGRLMFQFDESGHATAPLPPPGMYVQAFSRTASGFTTSGLEVMP